MGRHKVIVIGGSGEAATRTYWPIDAAEPAVHCLRLDDLDDAPAEGWLVEERPQWDELGEPGITRWSFLHRAGGIDRAEFARHWTDVHAPLARRHHPALRRYVQNIVIRPLGGAEDFDGIVELGFATLADLRERMYDSDEGRAAVAADVARFIDVSKGWRVVTRDPV